MTTAESDQPYAPPASVETSEAALPKTKVLLMVLLTLLTLGLYVPYWFWSRRRTLDAMAAEGESVGGLTVALVVLYLVAFAMGFLGGVLRGAGDAPGQAYFIAARAIDWSSRILIIVLSFRVKGILESNDSGHLSAVGTFFLSCFYLQYRINRLDEVEPLAERFTLR